MSFKEKLNALKTRLENDPALNQFCQSNFGKSLTVLKVFKQRTELSIGDLPIILMTRPQVKRKPKRHSVFLYAGFLSEDELQAIDLSIEFEELVEGAIRIKTSHTDDRTMEVDPGDSTNDEGRFHPVYFFVMEVLIDEKEIF